MISTAIAFEKILTDLNKNILWASNIDRNFCKIICVSSQNICCWAHLLAMLEVSVKPLLPPMTMPLSPGPGPQRGCQMAAP